LRARRKKVAGCQESGCPRDVCGQIWKISTDRGNYLMSEPESTLHTRPSLVRRLRDAADQEAWRQFVDTDAPLLFRWCRRQGLQDAAADVSQEALLQVARSIGAFEYQPERGRFRDWLGVIVRRLARFWERKGRGDTPGSAEAEETLEHLEDGPADPEWTDAFNAEVLRVALERLRPEFTDATWQVFEQTWLGGRPVAEAAAAAGVSVQAVYAARHRVLKRLEEEVLYLAEDLPRCVPLQ
jgi:RNA polymerase sigma-70 factor (ECF subfamily)